MTDQPTPKQAAIEAATFLLHSYSMGERDARPGVASAIVKAVTVALVTGEWSPDVRYDGIPVDHPLQYATTTPDGQVVTNPILTEIADERARQVAKWGEQNHPDGTGFLGAAEDADAARLECQRQFAEKTGTWVDILTEEVTEAYAEKDPLKLRAELVQVAAVAVAWIESIDRATQHPADGTPAELSGKQDGTPA